MSRLVLKSTTKQSPTPPSAGEDVIIAADLARSKWVYACRWGGQENRRLSTPGEISHLQALVREYQGYGCPVHVVYEACGFGYEIAWWMQEQGMVVLVVPPSTVEKAPGSQVKTDGHDASSMALRYERSMLKGIHIPTRACHQLRQLSRTYSAVVSDRKRQQVRVRMLLQEHGHRPPAPKQGWNKLEQWITDQELPRAVQASLNELIHIRQAATRSAQILKAQLLAVAALPQYKPLVRALTVQSGIGALTAIRFVLEVGDVSRFPTAGSIAHFYGLTPQEHSTGDTVRRGHIRKCGPAFVRCWVIQCAWVACGRHGDPELRAYYQKLWPRVGKKKAIVAVGRKLVLRLRARWRALETNNGSAQSPA
jgi:transposase